MQQDYPSLAEYEAAVRRARELRAETAGDMFRWIGRRIRNAAIRLYSLRNYSIQFRSAKSIRQ